VKQTLLAVFLLVTILACGPEPWPTNTIARWDGGSANLEQIEALSGNIPEDARSGEPLVRFYENAARELCIRDVLIGEAADPGDTHVSASDREMVRRQIVVRSWVSDEIAPSIEVTEEETREFHTAHPDMSRRPERRLVSHIFVRAGNPEEISAASSILLSVRARVDAGESFAAVADEISESETRDVGGVLGWVTRGQLQQDAENAIFSQKPGGISDPVAVHGGLAIFEVSQIFEAKEFPFEDVRLQIVQHLAQQKTIERLAELTENSSLPPGVLAIDETELMGLLESGSDDDIVYRDDGVKLDLEAWRKRLTGGTADQQKMQLLEFLKTQRLYALVERSGYLDNVERRKSIEETAQNLIDDRLATTIAIEWMKDSVAGKTHELQRWFDENHLRYQSPMELDLEHVVAPFDGDPKVVGDALRTAAAKYEAGKLETGAPEIPGSSYIRRQVTMAFLDNTSPRLRAALIGLEPPGCAPVLRFESELHLWCMAGRREPQPLTFEEAKEQVVGDYIAAHEQEVYAQLKAEILDQSGFEFNEAYAREVLHVAPEEPTG